jgi:hypothetical protein
MNGYKVLVGNPQGKKSVGRLRHRGKDNINMNIEKLGDMDWLHLSQTRD